MIEQDQSGAGAGTNPLTAGPSTLSEAPEGVSSPSPSGASALSMPHAQQAGDTLKYMKSQLDQTAAKMSKLKEAQGKATVLRQAMDKLAAQGDTITQGDVTKEAGALVAAGLSPEEVAGYLAEMPPDGEALQGWIATHDQSLQQSEAKLGQALAVTRHQLGVQALHHIGATDMVNSMMAQAPMSSDSASPSTGPALGNANALTGGM